MDYYYINKMIENATLNDAYKSFIGKDLNDTKDAIEGQYK